MASKFNFGKRIRVTGHEYRKMDYGTALRCGCCCENRFVSKRWHPSFKNTMRYLSPPLRTILGGQNSKRIFLFNCHFGDLPRPIWMKKWISNAKSTHQTIAGAQKPEKWHMTSSQVNDLGRPRLTLEMSFSGHKSDLRETNLTAMADAGPWIRVSSASSRSKQHAVF